MSRNVSGIELNLAMKYAFNPRLRGTKSRINASLEMCNPSSGKEGLVFRNKQGAGTGWKKKTWNANNAVLFTFSYFSDEKPKTVYDVCSM